MVVKCIVKISMNTTLFYLITDMNNNIPNFDDSYERPYILFE